MVMNGRAGWFVFMNEDSYVCIGEPYIWSMNQSGSRFGGDDLPYFCRFSL